MTLEKIVSEMERNRLNPASRTFWKQLAMATRAADPLMLSRDTRYNLKKLGYTPSRDGLRLFAADLKSGRVKRDESEPPTETHQHKEKTEFLPDGAQVLTVESTRLRTVADVVAYHRIDLEKFAVTPIESTFWEVGMKGPDGSPVTMPLHRLKCKIAPIGSDNSAWADLKAEILKSIPVEPSTSFTQTAHVGILAEPCIFDFHLGKSPVTGKWDAKTATRVFMEAVECFAVECERQGVERILFPIGNDFIHVDSSKGTTTAGTFVEPNDKWGSLLALGFKILCAAINRFSQVAPVSVRCVPGNHDADTTISICEMLGAAYSQNKRVEILPIKAQRQVYVWGKNLIGHSHGDKSDMSKIAMTLPAEFPKEYAATKYRFFRFGHLHRSEKNVLLVPDHTESFGIELVICPSLAPTDRWHKENSFVGNMRRARCFFYGKETGLFLERTFCL